MTQDYFQTPHDFTDLTCGGAANTGAIGTTTIASYTASQAVPIGETWQGQPVFRKFISFTTGSATGNTFTISGLGIGRLIRITGFIKFVNNTPNRYYALTGSGIGPASNDHLELSSDTAGGLFVAWVGSDFPSCPVEVAIDYVPL